MNNGNRIAVFILVLLILAGQSLAAADDDLISASDVVKIYTEEAPPENFSKDGKITGYVTDIIREILRRSNHTDTIQIVTWARGYNDALTQPNVALFSTGRTEQRENLFQWVGPVGHGEIVFFAKKGAGISIKSLDDARKVKSIGTYKYDNREQFLIKEGFTNIDSVLSNKTNAKKLVDGRIDLWICDENQVPDIAKSIGVNSAEIEAVFTIKEIDLYIAVSKQTNPEIVRIWQGALDDMHKDGTFEKILKTWRVSW